jgi:hypothetical protein
MKVRFTGLVTKEVIKHARIGAGSLSFEKVVNGKIITRYVRLYNGKGEGVWKGYRKIEMDVSSMGCQVSEFGNTYLEKLGYDARERAIILYTRKGGEVESVYALCRILEENGILEESEFGHIYEKHN